MSSDIDEKLNAMKMEMSEVELSQIETFIHEEPDITQIETFIDEAPDDIYLSAKIVLIFKIAGACDDEELWNVNFQDIVVKNKKVKITLGQNRKRTFYLFGRNRAKVMKYINGWDLSDRKGYFLGFKHAGSCQSSRAISEASFFETTYKEITEYINSNHVNADYLKRSNPETITGDAAESKRRKSDVTLDIVKTELSDEQNENYITDAMVSFPGTVTAGNLAVDTEVILGGESLNGTEESHVQVKVENENDDSNNVELVADEDVILEAQNNIPYSELPYSPVNDNADTDYTTMRLMTPMCLIEEGHPDKMATRQTDESATITVQLIKLVERQPCLWNCSAPTYKDRNSVKSAWSKIAKQLGVDNVNKVKATWKNLRDSHRYALKVRQGKKKLPPWKFEKEMKFLLPFTSKKDPKKVFGTLTNLNRETDENTSDSETWSPETNCFAPKIKKVVSETVTFAPATKKFTPKTSAFAPATKKIAPETLTYTTASKKLAPETPTVAPETEIKISDTSNHVNNNDNESNFAEHINDNLIKQFFEMMYATARKLPHEYQLEVKKKVFEIVMAAECSYHKSLYK